MSLLNYMPLVISDHILKWIDGSYAFMLRYISFICQMPPGPLGNEKGVLVACMIQWMIVLDILLEQLGIWCGQFRIKVIACLLKWLTSRHHNSPLNNRDYLKHLFMPIIMIYSPHWQHQSIWNICLVFIVWYHPSRLCQWFLLLVSMHKHPVLRLQPVPASVDS